ncbi:hypothetical protein DVH24_001444, partial [Malus domestica]
VAVDHSSLKCDQCASRIISIYCSSHECSIDWGDGSNTAKVDVLKEEVTTLKGQLAVQGEEMRAYAEQVRDLMSGLQISLLTPDLATPSTSEPLCPVDTQ